MTRPVSGTTNKPTAHRQCVAPSFGAVNELSMKAPRYLNSNDSYHGETAARAMSEVACTEITWHKLPDKQVPNRFRTGAAPTVQIFRNARPT
jgi:hypothetical protein